MDELFRFLTIVGVMFSIIGGILMFLKILTDFFIKKRLIEKELVNENVQSILSKDLSLLSFSGKSFISPLKWGLILLFGGIALISLEFIRYDYNSPLPFGVVTTAVGLGFLFYYVIARTSEKNK